MIQAAGILILNKAGQALFVKRGSGGDAPGLWCVPGGRIEPGEGRRAAAIRETLEEAGIELKPEQLQRWTRSQAYRETTGAPPTAADKSGPDLAATPIAADPVSGVEILSGEQVDFTCFLARNVEAFTPALNYENVAYAWAPVDQPPEPLHPGCRVALDRFTLDELGVAKAIRDGALVSPQRYENMWLFNIRVTGTGAAIRHLKKQVDGETEPQPYEEFVWRDPSIYLNEDFVERCQGLPVIIDHPEGLDRNGKPVAYMTGDDFHERSVGALMLAYMTGEDVWAIARIYDQAAAQIMRTEQLSTSPAVYFSDPTVHTVMDLANGNRVLIEATPTLLDHLAICYQGVWDKGGDPAGIITQIEEDNTMADETKENEGGEGKEDATVMLNKLLTGIDSIKGTMDATNARLDSIGSRVDAMDKERMDAAEKAMHVTRMDRFGRKDGEDDIMYDARCDAEEAAVEKELEEGGDKEAKDKAKRARKDAAERDKAMADAKKRDAEEKEEERKKEDSARRDSVDLVKVAADIEDLKSRTRRISDAELDQLAEVQARADGVYSMFHDKAPRPMDGELPVAYRRRLLEKLKVYSKTWKDADLAIVAVEPTAFKNVENAIYADAETAARNPQTYAGDTITPIRVMNNLTGMPMTEYVGRHTFIREMAPPAQHVDVIRATAH